MMIGLQLFQNETNQSHKVRSFVLNRVAKWIFILKGVMGGTLAFTQTFLECPPANFSNHTYRYPT